MTDKRHLTTVSSTEGAPSAPPPSTEHPMEIARKALREAAMIERSPDMRRVLLRLVDELPDRGKRL